MEIKSKMVVTMNTRNDDIKRSLRDNQTVFFFFQLDRAWDEGHRASRPSGLDDRNKMKDYPENIEHM